MCHDRSMAEQGEGWAKVTFEELGDGPGMRKVRAAAGITAFGANGMVLAPGTGGRWHWHDEQEEVYFVHRGTLTVEFEDGRVEAGPGSVVRVDAATPRRITNRGDEDLVMLALGGKDGYVGRDGQLRADELERVMAGSKLGYVPLED
jgi:mannose-6-phosphate isomerase-like protein (cupin superfamily)